MNFFGVHDPYTAWALLTFLALPPLLLVFYVALRLIARRNENARWEDARRELEDGDPDGPSSTQALGVARGLVPSGPGHEVRWVAGRFKGVPVALIRSRLRLTGDGVARIVALPPGHVPVVERANAHDFPPRDLARRLDRLIAQAPERRS